jgi:hypothetical protein
LSIKSAGQIRLKLEGLRLRNHACVLAVDLYDKIETAISHLPKCGSVLPKPKTNIYQEIFGFTHPPLEKTTVWCVYSSKSIFGVVVSPYATPAVVGHA